MNNTTKQIDLFLRQSMINATDVAIGVWGHKEFVTYLKEIGKETSMTKAKKTTAKKAVKKTVTKKAKK